MGNPKSTTLGVNPEVEDAALISKAKLAGKAGLYLGKIAMTGQFFKQVLRRF